MKNKGNLVRKGSATPQAEVPAPESTPVEATPAPAEPVSTRKLGLNLVGLGSLRRMDFQDALLEANREWHLTDTQLAIIMRCEHPEATGRIDESIVAGIRRLYNAGVHTKGQTKPEVPCVPYNVEGEATTVRTRRPKAAPMNPFEGDIPAEPVAVNE